MSMTLKQINSKDKPPADGRTPHVFQVTLVRPLRMTELMVCWGFITGMRKTHLH